MTLYRYVNSCEHVMCDEYEVLRETEKGYWLDEYGREKWTSKVSKRRFAYPTKQEALFSFWKRKQKQVEILTWQLENSKNVLAKTFKKLKDEYGV